MGTGRTQQAIAGAHEGLQKAPQRLKMAKNDCKGGKIEILNRINNQGPPFGGLLRGYVPYGDHGPSVRHSRGSKMAKNGLKNTYNVRK